MSIPGQPQAPDIYEVPTPAGAVFTVIGLAEKGYYEALATRYLTDNHLVNISDLQDLDRLIGMEVMVWRWQRWLSEEVDYWGGTPDIPELRKNIKEYSTELRLLKKAVGLDKASRDRERGESVVDYIENLKLRAKEFVYMRNEQAVKAITLFQELSSLITLHDNSSPDERRDMDVEEKDIIEWIRTTAIPEFEKIDANFRQTNQKYWVREI